MGKPLRAGSRSAPLRSPGIRPLRSRQGCANFQGMKDFQLYQQILGLVAPWQVETSRAWAIKEVFRSFWLCDTVKKAERYFGQWYGWAIRSRLEPVKKVARMCKRHLDNILTFFQHRHTNGPMEGLNNAIQGLIKKAYGYRNKERFKTDIFFHLGGLDLYPSQ